MSSYSPTHTHTLTHTHTHTLTHTHTPSHTCIHTGPHTLTPPQVLALSEPITASMKSSQGIKTEVKMVVPYISLVLSPATVRLILNVMVALKPDKVRVSPACLTIKLQTGLVVCTTSVISNVAMLSVDQLGHEFCSA